MHKIVYLAVKGKLLTKALSCMECSSINKNDYFIKETDTFGYIDILIIYTSHRDHFTFQQTSFQHSAACLSVAFELLPVFIQFAIL